MDVNRGGRGGDVLEDGYIGARVSGGVREKAWAHPGGTFTVHSNRKIRRKGPGREEIWAQCTHRGAPCIDLCGVICVEYAPFRGTVTPCRIACKVTSTEAIAGGREKFRRNLRKY